MRGELLLLLLAALNTESTDPEVSTGLEFIVVFPENIAYYHPVPPKMKVQITAMYNDTVVTIKEHTFKSSTATMGEGQTKEFPLDARMELHKNRISNKTLQITSTKIIAVQSINHKNNSVQTALVIPTDGLSTEYLIPPVSMIFMLDVTKRGPFKLIIVNTDEENKVTVEGLDTKEVVLQPYQVAQIWVDENEKLGTVKAEQPVAVLFGQTCAIIYNCTCGQLYTTLPRTEDRELKFYIPSFLAKGAETVSFVLLSKKDSPTVEAFNADSPLVETVGTAIFYRPGLLVTLIPETDFASCYVVSSITKTQSFAVIVVHRDLTDGVHVRQLPVQDPVWQELKGTEYVSTSVVLESGMSTIWHTSSKMAVYFMVNNESTLFGNPAAIISHTPDFRGCVLSPGVVEIGEIAAGWRESLKYCRDKNLELVSFPEAQLQTQIYMEVLQANKHNLKDVWIGLRRSSRSGEWYWLNGEMVKDTNWEEGEPGTVHDGQCAIMSLEEKKDFRWRDESCCMAAHPVCYKNPVLFPF